MFVYVVRSYFPDGHSNIVGVYDSEATAKRVIELEQKQDEAEGLRLIYNFERFPVENQP